MTADPGHGGDSVLDDDVADVIGESIVAGRANAGRIARIRTRVLQRIGRQDNPHAGLDTRRLDDGEWVELGPGIEKKRLRVDPDSRIESFLLRLGPGARVPRHVHPTAELCIVVAGEVVIDEQPLSAGDFHYAHPGSEHRDLTTAGGALLFLQSGVDEPPRRIPDAAG